MKRVENIIHSIVNDKNAKVEEGGKFVLSGQIPETKPAGYCYEIFQALSESDIQNLISGYRNPFPKPLTDFYRISNGMFMFGRNVRIFGVPEWAAKYKQPVALTFADGHRTDGCPDNRLFFASYNTNPETQLFFNTDESGDNMKVYAALYGDNTVIAEWNSFAEWFISEHERYSTMYKAGEYHMIDIVKGVLRNISFVN